MSLTSELRDPRSPITRFLDEHFPAAQTRPLSKAWYQLVRAADVVRPSMENPPWGTIGTAFDYRARYYWAETPLNDLVAAQGVRLLDTRRQHPLSRDAARDGFLELNSADLPPGARAVARLLPDFAAGLAETVVALAPVGRSLERDAELLLCRYCYVLALFEQIFRAGPGINSPLYQLSKRATLTDLLALGSDQAIDDLCTLSELFFEQHGELTRHPAILNPTFAGSTDIGGADADLIIETCLIDLKTTANPAFERKGLLCQLLGYVLLDYENDYGITEVGVYLARRGLLICWQLEHVFDVFACRTGLPTLRNEFKSAVAAAQAHRASLV